MISNSNVGIVPLRAIHDKDHFGFFLRKYHFKARKRKQE